MIIPPAGRAKTEISKGVRVKPEQKVKPKSKTRFNGASLFFHCKANKSPISTAKRIQKVTCDCIKNDAKAKIPTYAPTVAANNEAAKS